MPAARDRQIMDANGATSDLGIGDQIFDNASPGASVFGAVHALQSRWPTSTVPEGDPPIMASTRPDDCHPGGHGQLGAAQTQLGGVLSFYGRSRTAYRRPPPPPTSCKLLSRPT